MRDRFVREQIERIDRVPAVARGPVEMRPGDASGISHLSDHLTPLHGFPLLDERFAQVKVRRDHSAAVIDVDHVAGEKKVIYQRYDTAVGSADGLADRPAEIDTEVTRGELAVE